MYVIHTDWCDIYCLTGVIYLRLCSGAERSAFEGKVVSTLEALMESMNQLKGNPSITQTEVSVWCIVILYAVVACTGGLLFWCGCLFIHYVVRCLCKFRLHTVGVCIYRCDYVHSAKPNSYT